jgi:hypothetical protein
LLAELGRAETQAEDRGRAAYACVKIDESSDRHSMQLDALRKLGLNIFESEAIRTTTPGLGQRNSPTTDSLTSFNAVSL